MITTFFNKKKTPNESASCPRDLQSNNDKEVATKNQHFLDLIKRLNLESYYPKKMTKVNTLLINMTSLNGTQPRAEGELPFCFLEKLLVLDYHLQYLVYRGNINTVSTAPHKLKTAELETFKDFSLSRKHNQLQYKLVSTQWTYKWQFFIVQMTLQDSMFLTKLSICQFALPLLVPNPCTSQIEFPLWSLRQIRRSWREVEKIGWEGKKRIIITS